MLRACPRAGLLDGDPIPEAAVDSTGLETRHASAHFRRRRGRDKKGVTTHEAWPKLTVALHTRTHLIAGAFAC